MVFRMGFTPIYTTLRTSMLRNMVVVPETIGLMVFNCNVLRLNIGYCEGEKC
jgi:hypothetical protein